MFKAVKLAIIFATMALLVNNAEAFKQGAAPESTTTYTPAVTIKGNVVETMHGGGYTYVCIQSDGQKQWAAMPPTEVNIGDLVEITPSMEMRNFRSKAVGRTFDSIYFSQGLVKQ